MDMIKFNREVDVFKELDPEMQLITLQVFLYVASRGICTQKDLEIGLGLTNGTASRNVSYWADMKRYRVEGMGLIKREEDPKDRRYKLLSLTPAGKEFYDRIRKTHYGPKERK